jgi:glycosyltransferase involved in cell wall biosynthesis
MRRILFLVPGGIDRITGGNVFDRAVVDVLRARDWTVEVREPRDLEGSWDLLVVDSLGFRFGRPQTKVPYVALAHQLPSSVAGFPGASVQERDVLRFAALVVTAGEWLRDALAPYTPVEVVTIPPGRDRSWAPDGPSPDAGDVLCVANAMPGKGVVEAVEAFGGAARQGVRLVIVGDLEADREEAERVRDALGRCTAPVETVGVVDADELSALYARARLLLTGSRYEGRPVAVIEAMASGVPVVGFDVPGLRELVRPGRDGLLALPGDVTDLSSALGDLLDEPDLAAAMGRAGRRRALGWPTWEETATRFAGVLESLLDQI